MTPEQVQAKLVFLAEAVERLRALPQSSLDEFRSDDRIVRHHLDDLEELGRHYIDALAPPDGG